MRVQDTHKICAASQNTVSPAIYLLSSSRENRFAPRIAARDDHARAAFHKDGDAPRAARRPHRKARGGRIPGVFDRRATQRGGMHRRPNATVFMKVSTKLAGLSARVL